MNGVAVGGKVRRVARGPRSTRSATGWRLELGGAARSSRQNSYEHVAFHTWQIRLLTTSALSFLAASWMAASLKQRKQSSFCSSAGAVLVESAHISKAMNCSINRLIVE